MRSCGLSAVVMLAVASPVWAQYPMPLGPEGPPGPAAIGYPGYPPAGMQPAMFAPGGLPPEYLPPVPGVPPAPGAPPAGAAPELPGCYDLDPAAGCVPPKRPRVCNEWWVRGDWLYWNLRDAPVPPLVVTGDPALANPAIPGLGNVTALTGPARSLGQFNGARVTIGRWFDPDGELGGEVSAFLFARNFTSDAFNGSASLPIVSVPVIGADGTSGVYDFAFPGRFAGGVVVQNATSFGGAEANLLHRVYVDRGTSFDGIIGYRFLSLNERLDITGNTLTLGPGGRFNGAALPVGVRLVTTDSFRATTEFHGAQIGGRFETRAGMFTITAFGKGGAGVNIQTLNTDGSTTASGFGVTRTTFGGVRVLPGNFGRSTNTNFSMMGETGIEIGFQVTKHVAVRAGYNLLWWSNVIRPGSVISPVLSRQQVPIDPAFGAPLAGPVSPVTVFRSSDFLAHGLTVGVVMDW